jgi:hypothetical protein
MILHLLTILLYLGWLVYFTNREAANDAWSISQGQAINHRREWTQRCAAAVITSALWLWFFFSPLFVLGWLTMTAFGFSAFFRYRLNRLRGKHACYVSASSSVYDAFFCWLSKNLSKACRWIASGAK